MDYALTINGTAIPNRRIYLNSKYKRISTEVPGKFSVEIKNNDLSIPTGKAVFIGLLNATIPSSFYTVNSSNNKFRFTIAGDTSGTSQNGTYSVTLEPGNYSGTSLATELQNKINTVLSNPNPPTAPQCVVTYQIDFNKFEITYETANASGTFTINATNVLFTAGVVTGFKQNVTFNADGTASAVSDSLIDLSGPTSVLIHCNELKSNVWTKLDENNSTVLAIIGLTGERFRSTIYGGYPIGINQLTTTTNILSIVITDQDNNLIDFNGVDLDMTLGVYIVDKKSAESF